MRRANSDVSSTLATIPFQIFIGSILEWRLKLHRQHFWSVHTRNDSVTVLYFCNSTYNFSACCMYDFSLSKQKG